MKETRWDGRGGGWLVLAAVPVAVFALVFSGTLVYFRLSDGDGATATGTGPRAASAEERGKLPAVSGEGRLIVPLFVLESEEPVDGYLASVTLDGSDQRPITKPPGGGTLAADSAPALSPDGTTVVFQRAVARPSRGLPPLLYVVGLDGSGLRRLTRGRSPELEPAWSPNGRRIAFVRHDKGGFDLFVCARDGSALTRLTHTPGADESAPAWSPDGRQIAFARYEGGFEEGSGDIWLASADGSEETLLLGGDYDDSSPAWSPDGRRMAFIRDRRLAVMEADGTALRPLTDPGDAKEVDPSWSPDGSRIVFTRDPGSLFVVAADGSGLARVPLDGVAPGAVWEGEG
jgi:TolB protein